MIKPLRIVAGTPWESVVRSLDVLLRDAVEQLNRPTPTLSCVIDTAALPMSITLPAGLRPQGLWLMRATVQNGDETVISGGAITWDARGAGVVTVHALDALAASTRYDAVFAVEE